MSLFNLKFTDMRVLSFCLFCFILCSSSLCDDKEPYCPPFQTECDSENDLPFSFKCEVLATIIDNEDGQNCNDGYTVEFQKKHCNGDLSTPLVYDFYECYEDGGITYLTKVGISTRSVDMTSAYEDIYYFLRDASGYKIYHQGVIDGYDVAKMTTCGAKKGVLVTFEVPNYKATVRATLN